MNHGHRWLFGTVVEAALAVALALLAPAGQDSLAADGIIYVDADAPGPTHDGSSWDLAFTDLQIALGAALPGNEIWVAAGTYKPTDGADRTISFQMKKGVAIYGGFDPPAGATEWEHRDWVLHETILSGDIGTQGDASDNSYHVFCHPAGTDLDSSAVLDGVTVTGGNANAGAPPHEDGAGMYNDGSSPTLANVTFTGNSAGYYGGGMANANSSAPTLTDCTFAGNSSNGYGGGMANYQDSSPVLANCTFVGNTIVQGGGGIFNGYWSSPVLTNCTFQDNSAGFGGGLYNHYSSPVLTNCTIAGNTVAVLAGGVHNSAESAPVLTNCILWGDTSPEISNDASSPVVTYSDVQGGYSGDGTIDADPLFVDPGSGDLHLGPDSPCIDAGSNAAPDLPDYDFEGDYRILDGDTDGTATADMGVDERFIAHYVDADAQGAGNGSTWEDAFSTLQPALDIATAGDPIWVAAGTYKPTAEHGGTGERYRSFQLMNGVAIYGGFDPSVGDIAWEDRDWEDNQTILSGDIGIEGDPSDNSYHVFYHPSELALDPTARLDGFTITGGNANHLTVRSFQIGGGMINTLASPALANCTFSHNSSVAEGGGIYNWTSTAVLTNCTFQGNTASYGGGMNNTLSSPALVDCLFSDNSATYEGGGMNNFTDSSPSLTNCTFDGNSAGTNGGGMANVAGCSPTLINCAFANNSAGANGGGLYNAGSTSLVVTNCTFWGNSANHGGGIYNWSASPTLTNCILWGDASGEIYNLESSPSVTHSDVQGSYPGAANIDADPLFIDRNHGDFHLYPCSPCIDAGNNAAPYLPAHDFEGDPRIVDGDGNGSAIVDMGVDEVAAPGTCQWVYLPLVVRNESTQ
jgi:hypothetical protein